jgi:hypothetical protein
VAGQDPSWRPHWGRLELGRKGAPRIRAAARLARTLLRAPLRARWAPPGRCNRAFAACLTLRRRSFVAARSPRPALQTTAIPSAFASPQPFACTASTRGGANYTLDALTLSRRSLFEVRDQLASSAATRHNIPHSDRRSSDTASDSAGPAISFHDGARTRTTLHVDSWVHLTGNGTKCPRCGAISANSNVLGTGAPPNRPRLSPSNARK